MPATTHSPSAAPQSRLVALSDGIFAVAFTLLVLDLRLPDVPVPNDAALQQRLVALIPAAFSFLLSFVVVALYWLSHHRLFQLLRLHDRVIEYANLVFLLAVCFIPAPTSVFGRYSEFPTAVALYAASQVLPGAALTFMWWYGVLRLVQHPGPERRLALYFTLRALATMSIFALSIPVALISADAGRLTWAAIPVAFLVIGRILHVRIPSQLRPSA